MRYKSAAALEMAVKAAAARTTSDTGRAISAFYFDRFLCRVFADGSDTFVLKGGRAMLARTVDARATRDIDLLCTHDDLTVALEELVRLAEKDLGDFISFEFESSHPIKAEDEYRTGLSARFTPILGSKRLQALSIDLVVDIHPPENAELIAPANRLTMEGLEACDYLVYPIEPALADKFCGVVETHDGRASSRVKDLVDIAIYATTSTIDGTKLGLHLQRETAIRHITPGTEFKLPNAWKVPQARQYKKLCQRTGLPEALQSIEAAASLARKLLNPAVKREVDNLIWNPQKLEWTP